MHFGQGRPSHFKIRVEFEHGRIVFDIIKHVQGKQGMTTCNSSAPSVACHPFCLGPPDSTRNSIDWNTYCKWYVAFLHKINLWYSDGNRHYYRFGFLNIHTWFILPRIMKIYQKFNLFTILLHSAVTKCIGDLHWKIWGRKKTWLNRHHHHHHHQLGEAVLKPKLSTVLHPNFAPSHHQ